MHKGTKTYGKISGVNGRSGSYTVTFQRLAQWRQSSRFLHLAGVEIGKTLSDSLGYAIRQGYTVWVISGWPHYTSPNLIGLAH
jgi:hypothetical protein